MRIALAGNPNSGKTTMFNVLTGRSEKVGNWAGVTVEKKEYRVRGAFSGEDALIAVDLPGAYSMSAFTSEESVTSEYVKNENPDAIINIVDATNLSRSLFFTTQLLELGIPVVVALNKTDINQRRETEIDCVALSERLGCPVVETVSTSKKGMKQLIAAVKGVIGKAQAAPYAFACSRIAGKEADLEADKARYAFVNELTKSVEKRKVYTKDKNLGDKIDDVLTNQWFGLPIFAVVMYIVFFLSQSGPTVWFADLMTGWLELFKDALASLLGEGIFASLFVEGIVGGFIAIVGFLPLVMVMYFLIALLEDCGYMARATIVLDPIFKKVGLSGKSVIPFIVGTGCAVPGVMASRTIRDERERRATALLAPFMPCGAKLPVISLFAGAFFMDSPWLGALMYFIGIALIFLCALLIRGVTGYKGRSYFLMELPEYKAPSVSKAAVSMLQRGWAYIVKAGTIILLCNFTVHLMQSFDWRLQAVTEETVSSSILATVATPVAYIVAPLVGVVAWQFAAACVTGFIAKENVVATLAVCFGISNLFSLDELAMSEGSAGTVAATFGITSVAALSLLLFNLFTPPCFAAIGAMNAELKSKKWLFAGLGMQLGVGYTLAFLVYYFGTLFTGGAFAAAWMPLLGWAIVLSLFALTLALILSRRAQDKKRSEEKEAVAV